MLRPATGLQIQVLDCAGADGSPRKPPEGGTPNARILGVGICVDVRISHDSQKLTFGVPGLPGSSGVYLLVAIQPSFAKATKDTLLDYKSRLPAWGAWTCGPSSGRFWGGRAPEETA